MLGFSSQIFSSWVLGFLILNLSPPPGDLMSSLGQNSYGICAHYKVSSAPDRPWRHRQGAGGPGRSLAEVALATPIYSSAGVMQGIGYAECNIRKKRFSSQITCCGKKILKIRLFSRQKKVTPCGVKKQNFTPCTLFSHHQNHIHVYKLFYSHLPLFFTPCKLC